MSPFTGPLADENRVCEALVPSLNLEAVEALTQAIPKKCLEPSALAFLKTKLDTPWGVAVSGGADSVCLLLLVWAYFPQQRPWMTVLHVDHGWRGEASEADAQWVEALALKLGLGYLGSKGEAGAKVNEEAARRLRFGFLEKNLSQLGSDCLILGHNAQDVAENFLLRCARGGGLSGLAGLRPVQKMPHHWRLRPLLTLDPKRVRASLSAAGLSWREDATNEKNIFLRNSLRNQVLPAWQEALGGRSLLEGVLRSRKLLDEADEALWEFLHKTGIDFHSPTLDLQKLKEQPRALVRRGLEVWLWAVLKKQPLGAAAVEVLIEAVLTRSRFRMSAGAQGFLLFKKGILSYETPPGLDNAQA